MNIDELLIYLAITLFLCLMSGKVVKQFKLPNVTGYLIIGLLAGPSVLHIINEGMVNNFAIVSKIALGFIAFSIGTEFEFKYIRKLGAVPVVIAIFESLGATAFVIAGMLIFRMPVELALIMGAIAAATDPAATILVAKQYKASGPVTRTLIPVVAIDDATALMSYGICVAIAKVYMTGHVSAATLLSPVREIFGSLLVGIVMGLIFTLLIKFYTGRGNRLAITIAMVALAVSLSDKVDLSPLLTCMAMSITVVNTSSNCKVVFEQMDRMTPPIFMMFFFMSGAGLDIGILPTIGTLGIIYIVFRVGGKLVGAAIGGKLSKAEPNVQKFLGIGLIPQAGVAIGLASMSGAIVPQYSSRITAVVLCGTVIYELVGPVLTKITLTYIGEIKKEA
ncbi:MAG: cation:proton antiporter [Lachnospiraceae bacterium]|nr:cation:proton antiporter [Lachnospiraceae bacterium]